MKKKRGVGALPVRRQKNGHREVLLVTTRGSCEWTIPKGHRSRSSLAAAREAKEEGGVRGKIGSRPIGKFKQRKRNRKTNSVEVFPLKVKHICQGGLRNAIDQAAR